MIELLVLGLLSERDLHGYEIRQRIKRELGFLAAASFGSIYPAIARLKEAGAVEEVAPVEVVGPSPGSLTGERSLLKGISTPLFQRQGLRSRKVYRITDRGRRLLKELLVASDGDEGRAFGTKLAFSSHLSASERADLIRHRLAKLRAELAELAGGPAWEGFMIRAARERARALAQAEVAFLEGLLKELETTEEEMEVAKG